MDVTLLAVDWIVPLAGGCHIACCGLDSTTGRQDVTLLAVDWIVPLACGCHIACCGLDSTTGRWRSHCLLWTG